MCVCVCLPDYEVNQEQSVKPSACHKTTIKSTKCIMNILIAILCTRARGQLMFACINEIALHVLVTCEVLTPWTSTSSCSVSSLAVAACSFVFAASSATLTVGMLHVYSLISSVSTKAS